MAKLFYGFIAALLVACLSFTSVVAAAEDWESTYEKWIKDNPQQGIVNARGYCDIDGDGTPELVTRAIKIADGATKTVFAVYSIKGGAVTEVYKAEHKTVDDIPVYIFDEPFIIYSITKPPRQFVDGKERTDTTVGDYEIREVEYYKLSVNDGKAVHEKFAFTALTVIRDEAYSDKPAESFTLGGKSVEPYEFYDAFAGAKAVSFTGDRLDSRLGDNAAGGVTYLSVRYNPAQDSRDIDYLTLNYHNKFNETFTIRNSQYVCLLKINGVYVERAGIIEKGGKPYIPLRRLCNRLGWQLEWNGQEKTISVMGAGGVTTLQMSGDKLLCGGKALDSVNIDGRVYLSAESVGALGLKIGVTSDFRGFTNELTEGMALPKIQLITIE